MSQERPPLCAFCGTTPVLNHCPRCHRSQDPIRWEPDPTLDPGDGCNATHLAGGGLLFLASLMAMVEAGIRPGTATVLVTAGLGSFAFATGKLGNAASRAARARSWRFASHDGAWHGGAATVLGKVISATGLTTERRPFPADGCASLTSEAAAPALLGAIDPGWLRAQASWFAPRSADDRALEAALALASALLGMAARGEIELLRSYPVGWRFEGGATTQARWPSPERCDLELRRGTAPARGGWLERRIAELLAELAPATADGEAAGYRSAASLHGGEVKLQQITARLFDRVLQPERWPWLLAQLEAHAAAPAAPSLDEAEQALRNLSSQHPEDTYLLLSRLRSLLGVQGLVVGTPLPLGERTLDRPPSR